MAYPPRQFADARGIWREDTPGKASGIAWGEVYKVTAFKLDTITRIDIVLNVDFDWGEYVELNDEWPGFAQVVEAITARLPGVASDWHEQVRNLEVGAALLVWHRAPVAAP